MTKSGPSRIRISFSRPFTEAEKEYFQGTIDWRGVATPVDVTTRLNGNEKLWLESNDLSSRDLFQFGRELVESTFVNVFPVAVRTFRELG